MAKKSSVRHSPTAVRVLQRKEFTEGLLKRSSAPSAEVDATFPLGTIIGGTYKIIKLLGIGGMGAVYLVEHTTLNKRYALKVLAPELVNEQNWLRFQAEAKTVASLNHATFVKVYDLGIHGGLAPFYSMDYLPGRTLEQILADDGPLEFSLAIDVLLEVLDGLAYAHRNGVIHRDLKPGNIMIDADKKVESVKVLDFGISKLIGPDFTAKQSLTAAGEIFGSPFYMSPEQCTGGVVDARSDIYSIGCTLFELITGFVPFEGSSSIETILMHEEQEVPSLFEVAPDGKFPPSLDVVLAKALAKSPQDRYQSAKELAIDLTRIREGKDLLAYSTAMAVNKKNDRARLDTVAKPFDIRFLVLMVVVTSAIAAITLILRTAPSPQNSNKGETSEFNSRQRNETGSTSNPREKTTSSSLVKAWELDAYSTRCGHYQGLISQDKVIFDNDMVKYSLSAPNYDDMTVYGDLSKKYSKISLRQWLKQMLGPDKYVFDKVIPDGVGTIAGLKCQRYKCAGHWYSSKEKKLEATLWTTSQLDITEGLARSLAQFARVPEGYGAPVRMEIRSISEDFKIPAGAIDSAQSGSKRVLELFSAKPITVDSQKFVVPPVGYKEIADHRDLYTMEIETEPSF